MADAYPYQAAAMTRPDYKNVCGILGPYVKISAKFERPAQCNRIKGHEALKTKDAGTHSERDPHTFHMLAWWTTPADVAPNKRRSDKRRA
jgi:hypothetical protein